MEDSSEIIRVLLTIAKTHPEVLESAIRHNSSRRALLFTTLERAIALADSGKVISAIKLIRSPLEVEGPLPDETRVIVMGLKESKDTMDAIRTYVKAFDQAFNHMEKEEDLEHPAANS